MCHFWQKLFEIVVPGLVWARWTCLLVPVGPAALLQCPINIKPDKSTQHRTDSQKQTVKN